MEQYKIDKRFLIFLYFIIFYLLFLISGCKTPLKEPVFFLDDLALIYEDMIDVSLEVTSYSKEKKELFVSLSVRNKLSVNIAVYKGFINFFSMYDDNNAILWNWWIKIFNEKGEEAKYLAIMASLDLENLMLGDCLVINSGETITVDFPNIYYNYDLDNFEYENLNFSYFGPLGKSNNIVTISEDM